VGVCVALNRSIAMTATTAPELRRCCSHHSVCDYDICIFYRVCLRAHLARCDYRVAIIQGPMVPSHGMDMHPGRVDLHRHPDTGPSVGVPQSGGTPGLTASAVGCRGVALPHTGRRAANIAKSCCAIRRRLSEARRGCSRTFHDSSQNVRLDPSPEVSPQRTI
jgi:hypothetical protein